MLNICTVHKEYSAVLINMLNICTVHKEYSVEKRIFHILNYNLNYRFTREKKLIIHFFDNFEHCFH